MDYKDYKFSEDKDSLCLDGSRVPQVRGSSCLQLHHLTFLPWRVPARQDCPSVQPLWVPGTAEEGLAGWCSWCGVRECTSQCTGLSNPEERECNEKQMIYPFLELLNS